MTSAPLPPLGAGGTFRWLWRQLTSMRTALVLLFLLAIASVPGSLLPQRGTNPLKVNEWIAERPDLGPWVDRLGLFDVYASPWFAAVYLLLFISLIGCVLPRTAQLWRSVRTPPPAAPRRLERLSGHVTIDLDASVGDVVESARSYLRKHRWHTRVSASEDAWVAGEKGYLREAGNLGFHLSLLVILVSVAVGGLFGWKGNVIVREGTGFSDTLTQYDAWGGGRYVDSTSLPPFSFTLDEFRVDFERGQAQRGAPRLFEADLTFWPTPSAAPERRVVEVNKPLVTDGVAVYLVGHGYAPHVIVRDSTGRVMFDDTVPFLPQDGNQSSTGVIKVPDMQPQLGIEGLFLPTTRLDEQGAPYSDFPAPDNPSLVLSAFTGDLGLDEGVPQSVYSLKTEGMDQVGVKGLFPGDTWDIPGVGSVEFAGFERWASFQISFDPGKWLALVSSAAAITGLTLSILLRRRRLWVRAQPLEAGGTLVAVAGMVKGSEADMTQDIAAVVEHLARAFPRNASGGSHDEGNGP